MFIDQGEGANGGYLNLLVLKSPMVFMGKVEILSALGDTQRKNWHPKEFFGCISGMQQANLGVVWSHQM